MYIPILCMYMHMYTCMHVCMHACTVSLYVCMFVCMYDVCKYYTREQRMIFKKYFYQII